MIRGSQLYKANCSGCHGTDPELGTQAVYKGKTASVLAAAYRSEPTMRVFQTLFTTQDTADVAAFIASRVP